jgi:hypothetical protein
VGAGVSPAPAPVAAPAPAAQVARASDAVVVIPQAAIALYTFDPDSDLLTSKDPRQLTVGSVVQIGDEIVKIESVELTGSTTTYRWVAPTVDEAYDEIDISIPSLEVSTQVLSAGSLPTAAIIQPNKGSCDWDGVMSSAGGVSLGLDVDCKVPAAARGELRFAGRLTTTWTNVRIRKSRGAEATHEFRMTVSFSPEVGLKVGAGDSPAKNTQKARKQSLWPDCVWAAMKKQPKYSVTRTGSVIRAYLGTMTMGRYGIASVQAPACLTLDATDSRVGFEAVGQGEWSFTIVKPAGSSPSIADYRFEATKLIKAVGESALLPGLTLGSTGLAKLALEVAPTLELGKGRLKARVFGLVITPSFDVETRAWSTLTKSNVCADGYLRAKLEFFVVTRKFDLTQGIPKLERQLFKNAQLEGDECEPPLRPVYETFSLPYRAIRPFEPICPYEYAYSLGTDLISTYTVASSGCGIYQEVSGGVNQGYGYSYEGPNAVQFNHAKKNTWVDVKTGDISSSGPLRKLDLLSRFEGKQCDMNVAAPNGQPESRLYTLQFVGEGVRLVPSDPDDAVIQIALPITESGYSEGYTPAGPAGKKLQVTLTASSSSTVHLEAVDRTSTVPDAPATWFLRALVKQQDTVYICIGRTGILLPGMY